MSDNAPQRQPRNLAIVGVVIALLGVVTLVISDVERAGVYGTITGGLIVAAVGLAWAWRARTPPR